MSTSLLLPGEIIEDYSMCNRNTKEKLWGGHEKFFELEKMIKRSFEQKSFNRPWR